MINTDSRTLSFPFRRGPRHTRPRSETLGVLVEGAPRVLVRSGGELIRRTALALMLAVVLTGCEKPVHYSDWLRSVRPARHHSIRVSQAPLHQGEPGYSRDLDRDGNGVACQD